MPISDRNLIERLRQRNVNPEHASNRPVPPRSLFPPVAIKDLQIAEQSVAFTFPELLRANDPVGPEQSRLRAPWRRRSAGLGNSFWDQGRTVRIWLEGWLDGEAEPEPKWPGDAWMKNRLGFTLP